MPGRLIKLVVACLAILLCGSGTAAASGRIVGGSPTSTSQYPWMAAMVLDPAKAGGNALQRQRCGGALVTPYIVLTAAHCLAEGDPDLLEAILHPPLEANDINVVLGRTTLSGSDGAEHDVRAVAFASNYNPASTENDVGYIVLQAPSGQAPIKIAGSGEAGIWAPGAATQVTGWGGTSEAAGPSNTLRAATVPIISDSSCAGSGVYGSRFYPAVMVCAGYLAGGVDSCNGDSGGPLQAPAGDGYRLVGLTSWGDGCARPNKPGVYARVAGDQLRNAIAAKVFELESAHGLPHTNVIGEQAQGGGNTTVLSGFPSRPGRATNKKLRKALRKCGKVRTAGKRKRCIKRAKRRSR